MGRTRPTHHHALSIDQHFGRPARHSAGSSDRRLPRAVARHAHRPVEGLVLPGWPGTGLPADRPRRRRQVMIGRVWAGFRQVAPGWVSTRLRRPAGHGLVPCASDRGAAVGLRVHKRRDLCARTRNPAIGSEPTGSAPDGRAARGLLRRDGGGRVGKPSRQRVGPMVSRYRSRVRRTRRSHLFPGPSCSPIPLAQIYRWSQRLRYTSGQAGSCRRANR